MTSGRPVLVLGTEGLLGGTVLRLLEGRGLAVHAGRRPDWDLSQLDALRQGIETVKPGAIVNCAAFTDVAGAERPEAIERVFVTNRDGPRAIARAAARLEVPLLHVSTDYVFDGTARWPYREEDPTGPLQIYGRSKLEGERAVLETCPRALVVRTSTMYGEGGRGRTTYVTSILQQAATGRPLEVVRLPVASPTYALDLAEAALDLLGSGASGVVHAVNQGGCSRLELARAVVEAAGWSDRVPVREREQPPDEVARPAYSVLDTSRLAGLLGRPMRPWRAALSAFVAGVAMAPGEVV